MTLIELAEHHCQLRSERRAAKKELTLAHPWYWRWYLKAELWAIQRQLDAVAEQLIEARAKADREQASV